MTSTVPIFNYLPTYCPSLTFRFLPNYDRYS